MASMRQQMPQTAAWIDELRAVFCTNAADLAAFNRQIKAGLDGQPTFYASENGHQIGTQDRRQGVTPVLPIKTAPGAAPGAAAGAAGSGKSARGRA